MSELFNPAEDLGRVMAEGGITEEGLEAITGIRLEKIRSFVREGTGAAPVLTTAPPTLSNEETLRLSVFVAQLTEGLPIGDDERLKAIYESLTVECRLTPENNARLTGLDGNDVDAALRDPRTIPIETKYELIGRGSYLINAANQARAR
jgi:hypothetical protein